MHFPQMGWFRGGRVGWVDKGARSGAVSDKPVDCTDVRAA